MTNPALGRLASLPLELRLQIWNYLPLDLDGVKDEGKPPRQHLAILYTSRQINHEASTIVYANLDLQFTIDPYYNRKAWLYIKTNFGTDYALRDIDDAVKRGFDKLPYSKLRRIQIDIKAPHRRDPGQIVSLYKKCTMLATLLEHAQDSLPDLSLRFSDSPSAKWTVDNAPQKSVACDRPRRVPAVDPIIDRPDNEASIYCDDSQIVLCAFLRLRNARSAQISIPDDMQRPDPFFTSLENIWTDEDPFGTYLDPDYTWNDTKLQERMDITFTDLDLELDMLPGPTADMLRLERFSGWYADEAGGHSPYEREYGRILSSWTGWKQSRDKVAQKLNWRYGVMRALNPRSLYYQYTRPQVSASGLTLFMPENDDARKKSLCESGSVSKMWDQDAWFRAYENGIPPFRLQNKWELLHIFWRFHSDVLPKEEYDMKDKLRAWVGDDIAFQRIGFEVNDEGEQAGEAMDMDMDSESSGSGSGDGSDESDTEED